MLSRLTILALLITSFFGMTIITAQDDAIQDDTIVLAYEDVLEMTAIQYDVSVTCLAEANTIEDFQSEGTLNIDTSCPPYDAEELGQGGGGNSSYTVVAGDNLAKIAERFDATVKCIQDTNYIVNPNLIYVGQILTISSDCANSVSVALPREQCVGDRNPGREVENGVYTVRAGDMLDFIGCDLNMETACLKTLNNLEDGQPILIGQELIVSNQCTGWVDPFPPSDEE